MTSYEFEVAAKNAVIEVLKEQYDEEYDITQIHMVWFAHILGYKKAILIDLSDNLRMYEVTYNREINKMYVDVYDKQSNTVMTDIDTEVRL